MTTWTTTGTHNTVAFTVYFPAIPPRDPPLPTMFVDRVYQALAWLELDLPTSKLEVRAARKRLAREHHPDKGGDIERMKAINAAADFLLELT